MDHRIDLAVVGAGVELRLCKMTKQQIILYMHPWSNPLKTILKR